MMRKTENQGTDIAIHMFPDNLARLINALTDYENFNKKHEARLVLVRMGKRTIPQMHKLLVSDNSLLRMEAAKIVELVADKRSIPLQIKLLNDPEFDIRWIAAEGLIKNGRRCIIPLLKAIRDGKSSMLLDKQAHHVLNNLLYEEEKEELASLMLSLDNYLGLSETAPVEALKALKIYKKFGDKVT